MINKVYDEIVRFFKKNLAFYISLVLIVLVCTFPLPYYINAPGGLINLESKITIDNSYPSKGSLNMAYVSEINVTLPTLIYSYLNKNWTLVKKSEIIPSNETVSDMSFRDHILLDEAVDNAIILGFTMAGEYIEITKRELFVTYVDAESITDLKVGDQILEVDGIVISNKEQLYDILGSKTEGDKTVLLTKRDGRETLKEATMKKADDKVLIGIMISERKEYDMNRNLELHFTKSESGPSGGLMTSLAIYDALTDVDITNGKKIVGTGTIDLAGNVGSIGGVTYKIKGAVKKKADIFLVPAGENYEEAKQLVEKEKYKITLVPIETFDDALNYLLNM